MIMAGGCASETLSDFGEGEGHAWIAFPFFVLFAAPGQYFGYILDNTTIGKIGVNVWLPQYIGYWGALLLTVAILFVLYLITKYYENKKKAAGAWAKVQSQTGQTMKSQYHLMKNTTSNGGLGQLTINYLSERWSFLTGGIGITLVASFIMITTNKAWGVTTPFVTLDQKIFQLFGMQFHSPAFDETAKAMSGPRLMGWRNNS